MQRILTSIYFYFYFSKLCVNLHWSSKLNNRLAETRAAFKQSQSLLTVSSDGNLRYVTCQEALAAGTQWHASAQTKTLAHAGAWGLHGADQETKSSLDGGSVAPVQALKMAPQPAGADAPSPCATSPVASHRIQVKCDGAAVGEQSGGERRPLTPVTAADSERFNSFSF